MLGAGAVEGLFGGLYMGAGGGFLCQVLVLGPRCKHCAADQQSSGSHKFPDAGPTER